VFLLFLFFQCITGLVEAQQFKVKFPLKEAENFGLNPLENQFNHKAYPIVSQDSSELLLLLSTSGTLKALQLNTDLTVIDTFSTAIPEVKELNTLLGGFQVDSSSYIAIFSNKKLNSFSAFAINLVQKSITPTDFSARIKNEKVLHTFVSGDSFFIMTIVSRSSTIKMYKVFRSSRGNLSLSRYSYDFSKEEQDRTLPNLYKELMDFTERGNQSLVKIRKGVPLSLTGASSYFKLYLSDDKVILTMDHVHGRTSIYEMISESTIKNFQIVSYPSYITNNPYLYTSNSLLYGDTLIQVAISKEELALVYQQLSSGEIIREINVANTAIDTVASNLVYRDEKAKSKNIPKIFKEIYKSKIAFKLLADNENETIFQVGTARPLASLKSSQAGQPDEFIAYKQSISDDVSSFTLLIDQDDLPGNSAYVTTTPYGNLIELLASNRIKKLIIESITRVGNHYYYCWYSIFTNELVIDKISIN